MAETRIELTGNIWVHHPDKGVLPVPGADPVDPGMPTSYATTTEDVFTGIQTTRVYGPDRVLLSQWVRMPHGKWTQVAL